MRILTFLDLDDTIFQTERKCPPDVALEVGAISRTGEPLSFMTPAQRTMLEWLLSTTTVVPTTGRDAAALSRVQLPIGCRFTHGAIVNHGGTVLKADGSPDEGWLARVEAVLEQTRGTLDKVLEGVADLNERDALGLRVRLIGDFGQEVYLVIKHPQADLIAVEKAYALCQELLTDEPRLRVIANGNNVAVLPKEVSKTSAVAYVKERFEEQGAVATLGLGDSLSDLGYMLHCDYAALPRRSQIREELERYVSERSVSEHGVSGN